MKSLPVHLANDSKCDVTAKSNAEYDLYGFTKKPWQPLQQPFLTKSFFHDADEGGKKCQTWPLKMTYVSKFS